MERRALLRRACAVGALAVAGCTSATPDATGPSDGGGTPTKSGGDDGTPTESDGNGGNGERSIGEASVRTIQSGCRSDEESTATVSFPDGEVVAFAGKLEAPNPCHRVTVESADYDDGDDRLAVVLGSDAGDQTCVQCLGILHFEGSVAFDGGLPATVRVSDGETVLASVDRNGGDDGDGSGPIEERSFTVLGRDDDADARQADVEFDTDANRIAVRGTIEGSDGCETAELSGVEYDAEGDEVTLSVSTTDRPETDDQSCTDQPVEISYEATASFVGEVPRNASVVHDGQAVMSAAHGSSSAGESETGGA